MVLQFAGTWDHLICSPKGRPRRLRPGIPGPATEALTSALLRFLRDARNVVVLGPVGVGKTFLATALGHVACRHRFQVKFTRADDMLRALRQSRLDNSRDALITELTTVDLLIIDDFALEPMTRDESRDVYQLFVERTGRACTIVTSNRDTAEWLAAFDDMLLARAAPSTDSPTLPSTWSRASPTALASSPRSTSRTHSLTARSSSPIGPADDGGADAPARASGAMGASGQIDSRPRLGHPPRGRRTSHLVP